MAARKGRIIKGRKGRIIKGAELKIAEQNKKPTVVMRPLWKLFSVEMKENEIRMKETNETNGELAKQIQENEKKKNNDVNNDELFPRFPKTLKQSDTEPLDRGDLNENVNDE